MLVVALSVVSALIAAASLVVAVGAVRRSAELSGAHAETRRLVDALQTVRDADESTLRALRGEVEDARFWIKSRLREVRSREASARHAVKRARDELAGSGVQDERLEEWADDLLGDDGDGSPPQGVLPLRPAVEAPTEVEDWRAVTARHKYGR